MKAKPGNATEIGTAFSQTSSSDYVRLSVELRNLVIQLPEFNTVIAFQELLGSGRRADIVRIFNLNNEMASLAANVSLVFHDDASFLTRVIAAFANGIILRFGRNNESEFSRLQLRSGMLVLFGA
jgi:hypothetical protein